MVVTQSPGVINLSGNLPKIIGNGWPEERLTAILKKAGIEIIAEDFVPDATGIITIDFKDVIAELLEVNLPDFESPTSVQDDAIASFSVELHSSLDDPEILNFSVIKGGVDIELSNTAEFLSKHFLTWQPQIKTIKKTDREWLTYYHNAYPRVRVKAYFTDHEALTETLTGLGPSVNSIDVSFPRVAALFVDPPTDPIIYDVWVETNAGVKLSYTQRYVVSNEFFEFDEIFIFENTVGGIDTIRFIGETVEQKDITLKRALFDKSTRTYFSQNLTVFKKNTGVFRSDQERKWALEFFISKNQYRLTGLAELQRIYIQSGTMDSIKNQLNSGEFEYAISLQEEYYSAERMAGVLPDPVIISTPPTGGIFTKEFTSQFQ